MNKDFLPGRIALPRQGREAGSLHDDHLERELQVCSKVFDLVPVVCNIGRVKFKPRHSTRPAPCTPALAGDFGEQRFELAERILASPDEVSNVAPVPPNETCLRFQCSAFHLRILEGAFHPDEQELKVFGFSMELLDAPVDIGHMRY